VPCAFHCSRPVTHSHVSNFHFFGFPVQFLRYRGPAFQSVEQTVGTGHPSRCASLAAARLSARATSWYGLAMEFLPPVAARVRSASTEMKYDPSCGWYRAEAPLSRGPIDSWLHKPGVTGTRWSPGGTPGDTKEGRPLRGSQQQPLVAAENRNLVRIWPDPPVVKAEKVGNVTRLVRVPVL
jgi:hypothetical protein